MPVFYITWPLATPPNPAWPLATPPNPSWPLATPPNPSPGFRLRSTHGTWPEECRLLLAGMMVRWLACWWFHHFRVLHDITQASACSVTSSTPAMDTTFLILISDERTKEDLVLWCAPACLLACLLASSLSLSLSLCVSVCLCLFPFFHYQCVD